MFVRDNEKMILQYSKISNGPKAIFCRSRHLSGAKLAIKNGMSKYISNFFIP